MKVGESGWLSGLLDEALLVHQPPPAPAEQRTLPPHPRARAHLRRMMHESGLRFGTPTQQPFFATDEIAPPEERLFVAVLRTFTSLGLDLGALVGTAPAPGTKPPRRRDQLLVLFCLLNGDLEEALRLDAKVQRREPLTAKQEARVEKALEQRAMSLAGDPVYGLVLHNGAVFVDALCFGLQAVDYFVAGRLSARRARRRMEMAGREKALLVEVLTALACVEHAPSFPTRRAILRQIEDLRLPEHNATVLRSRVKRFFERRPSLKSVVPEMRGADVRRFILEQTLLASLVNGHRAPQELAFIGELAKVLKFSPEEAAQVELGVAEFYAKNRSVVDVFTVSAGAEVMGEELMEGMQRTVEKNFQRLMREARRTGELSVLLAKAARGKTLTADERRVMRAQLLEVAKAIPALAIFAAPGGLLLLAALTKVLPSKMLPAALTDEIEVTAPFAKAHRRKKSTG